MKKLIVPILSGLVLSCIKTPAQDTKFSEKIQKEFTVSPNSVLAVYNIDGFIKVEGYAGNKVSIEVDKTLSAETQEDLEKGKREFKLEFEQKGDSLFAYIAEPWDSRPNRNQDRWNNDNRKIRYRSNLNFTIKVPKSMNLVVSTINNGDIHVHEVDGQIKANNINGKITLKDIKAANDVHTINGDVTINYLTLPPDNAKYYTLNGNLNISYPANFSADCEFKTFQGDFFTDFEEVETLPAKVMRTTKESEKGTTHKLSKGSLIRIGKGGKNLKFETFNGNIYIKKA
ncbi:hypothetical protein Emtol_2536 [Emticicia oligotrophica DSM 17448]|uniref:Adhesin domain-containing protein n=1 Tax=Emticicia oligotrophica (strain DSM 17448 / CIP 109782 / MTCC 6937 / GPTSA100-15) TaxID=929562 RepID=A0ABN4AMX9_EMTOG|nr:DUF4097 family beta strand repeat-containing protein [Emticicia oligotrophica]AFK03672.1 hypothetical protein Emtol_2536 [Emticicia oligotrophica DSM 17448]